MGSYVLYLYFVHFVVPMGISGRFPQGGKASCNRVALLSPNYNYEVRAGSFLFSIIHRTLT